MSYYIWIGVTALLLIVSAALGLPVVLAGRRARVRMADEETARRAAALAFSGSAGEEANATVSKAATFVGRRLEEAGIATGPGVWMARTITIAALVGAAVYAVTALPVLSVIAGLVALGIQCLRVELARRNRSSRFERQLAEALPMMAEMLRSGQSPARSLVTVAGYMDNPLKEEFSRAARDMGYGLPFSRAMDDMYRRVPCEDLRLLNGVVAVNEESGGNLADILDGIADTMQRRARMRGHVRAITASGRMQATIVACIPWCVLVAIWLLSREYLAEFFASGPIAIFVLGGVAICDLAGYLIIRRMYSIRID